MIQQIEQLARLQHNPSIRYRVGTYDDIYPAFRIFRIGVQDLAYRNNWEEKARPSEQEIQEAWETRCGLFEHLFHTAEQFWVAEQGHRIIAYARSALRENLLELTDFFVHPDVQAQGIGRELLQRAFPQDAAAHRAIVATVDIRAQALYLKSGVYPRFPIYNLFKKPEILNYHSSLDFEPLDDAPETLEILGQIDDKILGHRRELDHRWLLTNRKGFLYTRNGQVIGYGYIGRHSGPMALLDNRYFPDVLSHAETEAARHQYKIFGLDVPMINKNAVQHLLQHGFELSPFACYFMSDAPIGCFENYIGTSPMLIL